jgi:hypothetical protein
MWNISWLLASSKLDLLQEEWMGALCEHPPLGYVGKERSSSGPMMAWCRTPVTPDRSLPQINVAVGSSEAPQRLSASTAHGA